MVRRALSLMYSEVRGLHQAAYLLALFALGSQVLAVIRDRTLAHTFGAGTELDVYYAAFRVPDLLYVIFVSVLSVYVLLPFVERARVAGGDRAAARVLGQCFTVFVLAYTTAAGLLLLLAPYLTPWLFPGLSEHSERLTTLLQILLLQPLLLGISTICSVVTQAERRFVIYAISPLLYNIGIITGVVVFYPILGLSGLAVGVVLGAIGHVLVQVPLLVRSTLSFSFVRRVDWGLMREIVVAALPRAATLSIHQLVLFVLIGMATTMAAGSVAVFQFAYNLQSVPLVIIGMSYSVAAFPMLAAFIAKNDHDSFNDHVLSALRHIIFWSLPIIGLVVVLRAQLVRALYGTGSFDWSDTRLTAAVLAMFIISLWGQSILLLLVRAFYAAGKMVTPLMVAVGTATLTIGAAVALRIHADDAAWRSFWEVVFRLSGVPGTEVLALASAFTVGIMLEAVLLLYLFRRTFGLSVRSLGRLLFQASVASGMGAVAAYLTLNFVVDGVNQERFVGIVLQGVSAGLTGLVTIVLAYAVMRSRELLELYQSLRARIFKAPVIAPQQDTL
jgi:putative peptidoglycan lipid II flippase